MDREDTKNPLTQTSYSQPSLFKESITFRGGCLVFQTKDQDIYCRLVDFQEDSIRPDSMDTLEKVYKPIKLSFEDFKFIQTQVKPYSTIQVVKELLASYGFKES